MFCQIYRQLFTGIVVILISLLSWAGEGPGITGGANGSLYQLLKAKRIITEGLSSSSLDILSQFNEINVIVDSQLPTKFEIIPAANGPRTVKINPLRVRTDQQSLTQLEAVYVLIDVLNEMAQRSVQDPEFLNLLKARWPLLDWMDQRKLLIDLKKNLSLKNESNLPIGCRDQIEIFFNWEANQIILNARSSRGCQAGQRSYLGTDIDQPSLKMQCMFVEATQAVSCYLPDPIAFKTEFQYCVQRARREKLRTTEVNLLAKQGLQIDFTWCDVLQENQQNISRIYRYQLQYQLSVVP